MTTSVFNLYNYLILLALLLAILGGITMLRDRVRIGSRDRRQPYGHDLLWFEQKCSQEDHVVKQLAPK